MAELMQVSLIRHAGYSGDVAHDGQSRNRTDGLGGMRGGRVGAALAAVVLTTVALAACDDSPPPDPTSTPTITDSASPTPSPSPTSSTDLARARAEEKVREYYAVQDAVGQDPSVPLDQLESVAISGALDVLTHQFTQWRADGWVLQGSTRPVEVEVLSVNLDNSDPAHGVVPTVAVNVCYDVAGSDVVGKDGKSVVTAGRPDRGWEHLLVSNYSWDTDPADSWRVASIETLDDPPCGGD